MIPKRLSLKNFLSYRDATLDFGGLHTACICGANGAGKSSLLEAIAWAAWGQSRAASEDDVIHFGAQEAQVDFIFTSNSQTYRIIRTRQRGQATVLEFQIAQFDRDQPPSSASLSPTAFRSLTAKGVRATQQLILNHIKLDYDTFINSAYLRQGRADEFMLKRPNERKQILADLLKLTQYDDLAERAKDRARQHKGQIDLLERNLTAVKDQLHQRDRIEHDRCELEAILATMQQQQRIDAEQLQAFQVMQHQRQNWQQQLTWQQQQHRVLTQDCQRLRQELVAAQQQQQELNTLLHQESAIAIGYRHFQSLQAQEETLAGKLKTYQVLQNQRQQYQQQQTSQLNEKQQQLQQAQAQFDRLLQQSEENQHVLRKAPEVEAAMGQLKQARTQLQQLDHLQSQVAPLLQRRQQLQSQIDRIQTRFTTRLEELQTSIQQLQIQQERQPYLQQAVGEVSDRIVALEQCRLYQQRVRDRGLERRSFMERLQAHQRNYEAQLAAVEQKIQLLRQGTRSPEADATGQEGGKREWVSGSGKTDVATTAEPDDQGNSPSRSPVLPILTPHPTYPPCPLCDRPLDEHRWNLVLEKHRLEQQEILEQIWVIREQLSVAEREIQILRQEYRELESNLAQYSTTLQRQGQLQEQLQATADGQMTLQQMQAEVAEITRSLETNTYAIELHEELQLLDHSLQQLNYDEKNHALARGEVDRWRWAEIRSTDIKQAKQKQHQIAQQQPVVEATMATLQDQIEQINHDIATQCASFDQQLAAIDYNPERHNELRQLIRDAQPWQLRYQELCQARQQYPQLQQRTEQLTQSLQERQQLLQTAQSQIANLTQQLADTPDCQMQIHDLEQQIQQRRSHLDEKLAHLGRLQQQQQQLEALSTQHTALSSQLQTTQRQYRVYQELTQALGKNGIQALMIENALPQLEAETNQILTRLSANQLHVQFVTQRSSRRDQNRNPKSKIQNPKLIDTLDILIADARGTRPYETYSGGEAFRVNFAIRLAMARLLAHRSGTALQMLIVDEGFGTQDAEGCDRLIAAINAIAADFACILIVTHVPHFKESFQSRVEVYKGETGSQIALSM